MRRATVWFTKLHRGYAGLWATSVAVALCTLVTGAVFVDDSVATSSPAVGSGRRIAPVALWGWLFVVTAVLVLAALVVPRSSLFLRGVLMMVMAMPWVLWAGIFAGYALGHHGAGALGVVIWGTVAAVTLSSALTMTGYDRNPRPRP